MKILLTGVTGYYNPTGRFENYYVTQIEPLET